MALLAGAAGGAAGAAASSLSTSAITGRFSWEGLGKDVLIGAIGGGLSGGFSPSLSGIVSKGISSPLVSGMINGGIVGSLTGFVGGTVGTALNGGSFGDAVRSGLKGALVGGAAGAGAGAASSAISAYKQGFNPFSGKRMNPGFISPVESKGLVPLNNKGITSTDPSPLPDNVFSTKAPSYSNARILEGQYIDGKRVQPWKAYYDRFGRLLERTDWNDANPSAGKTDPHYHTKEYLPKGQIKNTDHIPGMGPNTSK